MTDFHSFSALGQNMLGAAYRVRPDRGPSYRSALKLAGQEFKEYFQRKIEVGGPGWDPLTDSTMEQRADAGFMWDDPLFATQQMYKAIDYQVDGQTLNVGIKGGEHSHGYVRGKNGGAHKVPMEDLFLMHEIGTSTMPARPIFTDTDFFEAQAAIAHRFSEYMIANGFVFDIHGTSKAAQRFRSGL